MALQKQVVPIPFTKGLDLKNDPKQIIPGKLLTLENGVFTSPGRIQKRFGYEALTQIIQGITATITQGSGLANFKNEGLLLTGNECYSYSDSTASWIDKQTITNLELSSTEAVRNTHQQTTPDAAIHSSGLEVVAYEDNRGGSRYCVTDTETGDQIISDQLISSTAIKPKTLAIGFFLVILYIDTATYHLNMLPISVTEPTTSQTVIELASDVNATYPNYDATLNMNILYYTYYNNTGGITTSTTTQFLGGGTPATIASEVASSCISISIDPIALQIWIAYHNGTQVKYFILQTSAPHSTILAPTVVSTNSNTILNIAIIANTSAANVYYTQVGSIPSNNFILEAHLTNAGIVTGSQVLVRSVSITGKPFTYNGFTYIVVSFDSVLQPTYFVMRTLDAAVVAKFSPGLGGGTPVRNIISESYMESPGIYILGSLVKDLLTTISGAVYTQTGVNVIELDFVDAKTSKVELGGNLHLTGGILSMYDGISVVEHGFNIYPENITNAQSNTGGAIGPGTYEYFVVYSWMDGQGQVNYSAPSVGFQVIIPPVSPPISFTATFSSGASTIVASSVSGLAVGQVLTDATTAANFIAGTYITSISGLNLGISNPTQGASASSPGDTITTPNITPLSFTGTFLINSTSITVSSTTGLMVGQNISDVTNNTYILPNTYITAIVGSVITINQPTLGAGTSDTLVTYDTNTVTLTIPTLRLTQKKPPVRGPVTIQVYRTEDSQTIGYLVTSLITPVLNDVTVDTVTFTDTQNDNEIVGNPTLYTTGGVIENIATPAFSYITTYQDRVIGFPEENSFQWWYSKQNIPGGPVEFTDAFVNNVNQSGGGLVSGLQMDAAFIFFQSDQIEYITGVGPDSTGNQNDFSAPLNIASDVGCVDKESVVLTPQGIYFKSQKGIYLLGRNLALSYVGADVEAYNNYHVVSANLIEDTQQVRFCLDNGVALVYDYYVNQWSVFTNIPAVDSIIFQGEFTYVTAQGLVLQETPDQWTDNGEFIKLKLMTGWLSFVGLQGYQRVYKMLFLGDYFSPHNVSISAAYDFNPNSTQQNVIPAGALLSTGVYGSDLTYGLTSPYGGPPQVEQFRVDFSRQKCETIQITIEDQQLGAVFGRNLALSAFSFEVGTKGTLNKILAQGSNTQIP